ncbi:MAG: hypothetical protein KC729_07185, partial [Candidatus Eisenbacteria bacterium]|nr:hypothetical protein [Candidatus Eisenbacteria bacterium]
YDRGYVYAVEFDADGYLLNTWGLAGIAGATGPAISAFARTAPGGPPGGEVLVLTHGTPGQLWQPDRPSTDPPALTGAVGNDPRQVRAVGELAVVTNYESDALTVVRWPYGGAASIVGTVAVGDGPVGVALSELPGGNVLAVTTGFNDDTITLTVLSPVGAVVSNETMPAPEGCDAPAFAAVIDGVELRIVVTCHESSDIYIFPVEP